MSLLITFDISTILITFVDEGARENPGKLSKIEFSRKLVMKFQGGVGSRGVRGERWGGVGVRGWVGGVGKFPRKFWKFPRNFRDDRELQHGLVQWENKILMYGLHKNNPTTMPSSPVEFLRKCNLTQFSQFFPLPFKCISIRIVHTYIHMYAC